MHDGKISVESVVGEGSRFAFDIPVQPKHSAPAGYQPPKTGQFDN
jgi:signal transduction histidine kinase